MFIGKNGVIAQCCVCGKIKIREGIFVLFSEMPESDLIKYDRCQENNAITHTYCPSCYEQALKDIETAKRIDKVKTERILLSKIKEFRVH